ncbi:pyridoxal phosphate-dependent aminotransferase [Sulfitobacter mediterraneus]|uniref:pyridoxal phosphate-dependent aminotransferase n=1 Tax=Sulfitobacter mediterraneus TaxID=83219 RepID=UPI0019397A41|nr:pyridoxal phosphate-dependent aminotransferase [Sulfitobacter mediterraneus]MBM1558217.1 pyridoxal phosphate-dependent aminotransferase [Sulfitobacter mediterraneus]MBM1570163.1 pyridoxal phosphate-dependent aminotransferase [Sulfitobacter mediterraneus]MBM1573423.1 pyridoxal phosphate-dependent aminotransferase [Sulfitobacter mediterraneus]MBM1577347.1 pyridoxal phosphate-dependent aminotransferase [Sulfitobacter mediterraneus]MBM1581206.1 pyridoxal phosphate-dependent aminotransferase [Su
MPIRPARRITDTSPKNFGMFAKAVQMKGDLIHLELGMPAEDTPQHIKDATIAALQAGHVHYSDLQGIPELRSAIADKLRQKNTMDISADEVIVTNGLTQASFAAFMAFLDEGDEALLLAPYYPQHIGKAELAGAKVTIAPLDAANGFSINRALLEPHINAATKVIALINPCNPTGRVYTRDELQVIADLAQEHDLLVLSDEVYEEITYDNAAHISIASLPGMKERTISMFAFTKAYAMDGWRLGYIAADQSLIGPMMKITTNEVTHVNTFVQHGALAALTGDPAILKGMVDRDRERRDLVVSRLNQMPGVTCAPVEGTIYAFPDISATGLTAQDCADMLLAATGVVVEAGSFYGDAGEGHLRVCFGCADMDVLRDAMDRMQRFFNDLQ